MRSKKTIKISARKTRDRFLISNVRKFLTQTGFPFEMEMSTILRKKSYDVKISKQFIDLEEGKRREIDIIARKRVNDIYINFIIECKQSLKDCWIFISPDKSLGRYWSQLKLLPLFKANSWKDRVRGFYLLNSSIPISTNFIAFDGKKQSESLSIKDAINKTAKATLYLAGTSHRKHTDRDLFFPMVLFFGKMFLVSCSEDGSIETKRENYIQFDFQFNSEAYELKKIDEESWHESGIGWKEIIRRRDIARIKKAYEDLEKYYLIEFVKGSSLISHINMVEKEVEKINLKRLRIKE